MRILTGTLPSGGAAPAPRAVGWWLLLCAAMVLAMMLIGAVTRLTDSGLSIMEWKPLAGALPPLTDAEWQRVFALYKTIPQYALRNQGMALEEFKGIFWWEWIHRQWGRAIGVAFLVPFLWFLWRRAVSGAFAWKCGIAFLLGGLQGAMGWWMVASGFSQRTEVSQYRLAAHLALAFVILFWLLWLALDVLARRRAESGPAKARPERGGGAGWALLALLGVTIMSGAFVAGTDAGLIYDTYPLMGGAFVPGDYRDPALSFWLNAFENRSAIQFHHRWLAAATVLAVLAYAYGGLVGGTAAARLPLALSAVVSLAQLGLGIATLLSNVDLPTAVAHQGGAAILFACVAWSIHAQHRPQLGAP
ncbi:MAG: COX15/CtaA family protein [Alphaproteobacteria bacterium]|nr:COX15/CtaA family protein [Alphaproteobacteria bacterium]